MNYIKPEMITLDEINDELGDFSDGFTIHTAVFGPPVGNGASGF